MSRSTVVVQIGNTDDKLSQREWSEFCRNMRGVVEAYAIQIHFGGGSPPDAPWQNFCWVLVVADDRLDSLRAGVKLCRKRFHQESAAVIVGNLEFA